MQENQLHKQTYTLLHKFISCQHERKVDPGESSSIEEQEK
jgi:hypothetical protein